MDDLVHLFLQPQSYRWFLRLAIARQTPYNFHLGVVLLQSSNTVLFAVQSASFLSIEIPLKNLMTQMRTRVPVLNKTEKPRTALQGYHLVQHRLFLFYV